MIGPFEVPEICRKMLLAPSNFQGLEVNKYIFSVQALLEFFESTNRYTLTCLARIRFFTAALIHWPERDRCVHSPGRPALLPHLSPLFMFKMFPSLAVYTQTAPLWE